MLAFRGRERIPALHAVGDGFIPSRHVIYSPDEKYIVVVGGVVVGGVTILDSQSFQVVKEIVRVANDVKGMKIDGVKGLDPVLEEALRRAI